MTINADDKQRSNVNASLNRMQLSHTYNVGAKGGKTDLVTAVLVSDWLTLWRELFMLCSKCFSVFN